MSDYQRSVAASEQASHYDPWRNAPADLRVMVEASRAIWKTLGRLPRPVAALGLVGLGVVFGYGAISSPELSLTFLSVAGSAVIVAVSMVFAAGAFKPQALALPVARAACARCGAPLILEAGEISKTCRACAAVVLPGTVGMAQLARATELAAQQHRIRQERQLYRAMAAREPIGRRRVPVAVWCLTPLIVLSVAGELYTFARFREEAHLWSGLCVLSVGGVGLLGAVAWDRWRYRLLDAPLVHFAKLSGGTLSRHTALPALDWLDANWPARAPASVMWSMKGCDRWHVAGVAGTCPFLLVVVKVEGSGGLHYSSITVLVAGASPPMPAVQALAKRGFLVTPSSAGIVLTHERIDPARRPEDLAAALTLVVGHRA